MEWVFQLYSHWVWTSLSKYAASQTHSQTDQFLYTLYNPKEKAEKRERREIIDVFNKCCLNFYYILSIVQDDVD